MGKVLIIKGADFSVNGIPMMQPIEIADTITLYRGYNALGEMESTNPTKNKRVGVQIPIDLSSYINNGYRGVKFTLTNSLTHMQFIAFCEDVNRDNRYNVTPAFTYDEVITPIDATRPYLIIVMKRNNDDDYISESYNASTLLSIELS